MTHADSERIVFDQVQIGTKFLGMWPVAQHGYVVVTPDTLSLLGTDEQLIDTAPITEVKAKRFFLGMYARLTMNGTKYSVAPGMGVYMPGPAPLRDKDILRNVRSIVHLVESAAAPVVPEPDKDSPEKR